MYNYFILIILHKNRLVVRILMLWNTLLRFVLFLKFGARTIEDSHSDFMLIL